MRWSPSTTRAPSPRRLPPVGRAVDCDSPRSTDRTIKNIGRETVRMRGSETRRGINQNAETHQWQLRIAGDFARYSGGRRRNFSRGRDGEGRWRRRSAVGLDGPFLQRAAQLQTLVDMVGGIFGANQPES